MSVLIKQLSKRAAEEPSKVNGPGVTAPASVAPLSMVLIEPGTVL